MAHKFCQSCGKEVIATMRVCPGCGAKEFSDQKNEQPPIVISVSEAPKMTAPEKINITKNETRPWVRYWARWIDLFVFSVICGFILGALFPSYINTANDYALGIEFAFLYMFVEPILLSEFGSTFGKWLLKVKLSTNDGQKITYSRAFRRSFKVWWRGFAANIPLVFWITHFNAYDKLVRNGTTSWDVDEGFVVTHEKIGWVRTSFAAFLIAIFFVTIVIATELKNNMKNQMWKTRSEQISDTRSFY